MLPPFFHISSSLSVRETYSVCMGLGNGMINSISTSKLKNNEEAAGRSVDIYLCLETGTRTKGKLRQKMRQE